MSERMVTPTPSATRPRTASIDAVSNTTLGLKPYVFEYFRVVLAASSRLRRTYGSFAMSDKLTDWADSKGCALGSQSRRGDRTIGSQANCLRDSGSTRA